MLGALHMLEPSQVRAGVLLRLFQVRQQGTRRTNAGRGLFIEAKAFQAVHLETRMQQTQCALAIPMPRFAQAHARAVGVAQLRRQLTRLRIEVRPHEDLRRCDARQFIAELGLRHIAHAQAPRRHISPRKAGDSGVQRHRQEPVVLARIQRVLFRQGSRRDDAHHRALDDALGLARVLHLLADRDLEALLDQAHQVRIGIAPRHTRHGDRVFALGARRERQPQLARRNLGVFMEQLVEVAHAEEQQRIRRLALGAPVLLHHRRVGAGGALGAVLLQIGAAHRGVGCAW